MTITKQEILERIERGDKIISDSQARCEALRIYTDRVLAKTAVYKAVNERDNNKRLNRPMSRVSS